MGLVRRIAVVKLGECAYAMLVDVGIEALGQVFGLLVENEEPSIILKQKSMYGPRSDGNAHP